MFLHDWLDGCTKFEWCKLQSKPHANPNPQRTMLRFLLVSPSAGILASPFLLESSAQLPDAARVAKDSLAMLVSVCQQKRFAHTTALLSSIIAIVLQQSRRAAVSMIAHIVHSMQEMLAAPSEGHLVKLQDPETSEKLEALLAVLVHLSCDERVGAGFVCVTMQKV